MHTTWLDGAINYWITAKAMFWLRGKYRTQKKVAHDTQWALMKYLLTCAAGQEEGMQAEAAMVGERKAVDRML